MKNTFSRLLILLILIAAYYLLGCVNYKNSNDTSSDDWKLIWSDEFNDNTVDLTKWYVYNNSVWGQSSPNCYYLSRNINESSDGYLYLDSKREDYNPGTGTLNYTSSYITTQGKFDFKYGKLQARIKMPYGHAMWPGFWTLGVDNAENNLAEIDIIEMCCANDGESTTTFYKPSNQNFLTTCHWGSDAGGIGNPPDSKWYNASTNLSYKLADDFHIYEVEWDADNIIFRFDGSTIHTVPIKSRTQDVSMDNAFRQQNHDIRFMTQMHNCGMVAPPQVVDATTTLPQSMIIDWVRVYQK